METNAKKQRQQFYRDSENERGHCAARPEQRRQVKVNRLKVCEGMKTGCDDGQHQAHEIERQRGVRCDIRGSEVLHVG